MFCCCSKHSEQDVLLTDQKKNERVIISSRSSSTVKADRGDKGERQSESKYEPPDVTDLAQRLSLPTSPAQKEASRVNATKHRRKAGYVKKKGHLVKNWKRRYLVLKDGMLTYYGSANPNKKDEYGFDEGVAKKGWTTLEGAKVELFSENQCRLQIISLTVDRSLLIETDSPDETDEWNACITDAIRSANIVSLSQGNRIPQVVQWYMEEYGGYEEARKVLEFGHLFKLHYIDPTGVIHLIKVWLQMSNNGLGLVFYVSLDGQNPPPAASQSDVTSPTNSSHTTASSASNRRLSMKGSVSSRFDGLEITFDEILSITKGTSENVNKTKDMGPDSAFFTMKTAACVFVLEVETRSKRDRWAIAIRDTVNFVHIPLPGVRRTTPMR